MAVAAGQRPQACCEKCGAASAVFVTPTKTCRRRDSEGKSRRCGGLVVAALEPRDWRKCRNYEKQCAANGARCDQCDGHGWILAKVLPQQATGLRPSPARNLVSPPPQR